VVVDNPADYHRHHPPHPAHHHSHHHHLHVVSCSLLPAASVCRHCSVHIVTFLFISFDYWYRRAVVNGTMLRLWNLAVNKEKMRPIGAFPWFGVSALSLLQSYAFRTQVGPGNDLLHIADRFGRILQCYDIAKVVFVLNQNFILLTDIDKIFYFILSMSVILPLILSVKCVLLYVTNVLVAVVCQLVLNEYKCMK